MTKYIDAQMSKHRHRNVTRTILQRLLVQAASVAPDREDTVLQPVYLDATTSGRIITRGEIVVAGEETQRSFPRTRDFPFHFRKTFTAESGPIKRGEFPAIEFQKTAPVFRLFPQQVPEPLGNSQWIYRCTAVCGQTFNALSPFVDIKAELAFELDLHPSLFQELHWPFGPSSRPKEYPTTRELVFGEIPA